MNSLLLDLRHALRVFAKSPGFVAVAVFTLALAIGVNSAIFSLVNSVVLRPLVPKRPEEVVNVFTARRGASKDYRQFSFQEFQELRRATDVFADVAFINFGLAGIGRGDGMRRSFVFLTSENFFALCGVEPAAGRFYNAGESRPNANIPVVVASYPLWQRMGGRPDFVGSTLFVNGTPHTVIGVTPKTFTGLNALLAPDLWLPAGLFAGLVSPYGGVATDLNDPKNYTLNLTARLAPGVTLATLPARLPALGQRLSAIQPSGAGSERELQAQAPGRYGLSTEPEEDPNTAFLSVALLAMAGCVLVIASLNLANMLLARGGARAREMAVRIALGATRGQIVRLLLVEGFILSLAGGIGGLLLAFWGNDLLFRSLQTLFSSMSFSLGADPQPNFLVLAATFLFCLAATLFFSLGPALKASRTDVVHDLKQQGFSAAGTSSVSRFFSSANLLVMSQLGLSLMLVFAAGLFVRGAVNAGNVRLGFDSARQIIVELDFSLLRRGEAESRRAMFDLNTRLQEQPGVQAVAFSTLLPYNNLNNSARVISAPAAAAAAADPKTPDPSVNALTNSISSGYFEAMGIPLLRGRDFTAAEAAEKRSTGVAIIDETLAAQLFPGAEALGQQIRYTLPPVDGGPTELEIVGIVREHRQGVLSASKTGGFPRRLFVPLAQSYNPNVFLHVALARGAEAGDAAIAPARLPVMLPAIRDALRAFDAELPVLRIVPFNDIIDRDIGFWIVRTGAVLFGTFGAIALILAAVGIYGVKAYTVSRRTREIGIRMALGADPRDVFALIMKQSALQIGVALGGGLLLSVAAGQVLASILYRVSPFDPLALGCAVIVLALAASFAAFVPARRATRVSPLTALRTE